MKVLFFTPVWIKQGIIGWVAAMVLFAGATLSAGGAELKPEFAAWLAAQTNIQSWSADFVQTRTLKSLTRPLTATGHVWFAAPNRFRWELGTPPQTIAVRAPKELLVIYPRLKRAEHFPLAGEQAGRWKEALALLEAGFPRSREDLHAQYNVLSQDLSGQTGKLVLQPKSQAARRMMPRVQVEFSAADNSLIATELEFADGSTLRNDFKNPTLNPEIEEAQFNPDIPADYKNIEPLKGRG